MHDKSEYIYCGDFLVLSNYIALDEKLELWF